MCVCFLTLAVLCITCIEGIDTFISMELRPYFYMKYLHHTVRAGRSEDRMPVGAKFSHQPSLALSPTQLHIQCVLGRGVTHPSNLAPRLKNE